MATLTAAVPPEICTSVALKLPEAQARHVANIAWALARLRIKNSVWTSLAGRLEEVDLDPQGVANATWALAKIVPLGLLPKGVRQRDVPVDGVLASRS